MARGTLTGALLSAHLVEGKLEPGEEIAVAIEQTLAQDATGTLVMLELEAMGIERTRCEVSAQYVDHNLLQEDNKNPDDHLFLRSAAQRFGLTFARPGAGVSHPVHMAKLGVPGKTLLGADSHTCAAGSLGMLAFGAGGLEVALAIAGEPYYLKCPAVWGVRLDGRLPPWVSAKDVVLEMLRRHGVKGGMGKVIEYYGEGVQALCAMDRHVIANMGAELGATTTVFPSDERTRAFLALHGREGDFRALAAAPDAQFDLHETIDLSALEPLIAKPQSPGNVVPVREVVGEPIYQSYIGSSANPGYRDFAVAAWLVQGREIDAGVSFDVNPSTREVLDNLVRHSVLSALIEAGARVHQAGCNGCIGMGQAPASGRNSLRTVPRNFPGRSGTREDSVWLCSPETAAASALTGVISDPREVARRLGLAPFPLDDDPPDWARSDNLLEPPTTKRRLPLALVKGPNIKELPELGPLDDELALPVLLKVGDDISTDEILPAGARVLPYRSNLPAIARFCFEGVDESYAERARLAGDHAVVGGFNYGQGSSREHAAIAPRTLGLRVVLAKSFARIHWQNLVAFGVLPLTFVDEAEYEELAQGEVLRASGLCAQLARGRRVVLEREGGRPIVTEHQMSGRQVRVLLSGGLIPWMRARLARRFDDREGDEARP